MAIIRINNAEVTRTFYNGKGAGLKETFKLRDGSDGARYYSAFFDEEHGLSEGDRGNFSGLLGTKVSTYEKDGETKYGVDVTLNSARFEVFDSGSASDDDDSAPF